MSFFFFDDKGEVIAVKCREAAADTDYALARSAALAPRVAAGLDRSKISEAPGKSASGERTETSTAAVRRPDAPLARPLRPVPDGMEGRVVYRPRRPVPAGSVGQVGSRPGPIPAGVIGKNFSGGVSPEL